jgi:putative ABC transport system substrate-binding protein
MMNRWKLVVALVCGLLGVALSAEAQRPVRVPRLGFLGMDSQMQADFLAAFQEGLRALGYVDGRTIAIEYRWAEGRFDRLPGLAAELVGLKVDVIVTAAPPSIRAVQRATTTIPIVMSVGDPVGLGFVESFAHPGGNITGVAFQDAELSTKRLDLLRQTVPRLARVAVLWNKEGDVPRSVKAVEAAARELGLQVLVLEIREPHDFASALATAKSWGAQGLVELASPFITKNRAILLELLSSHRMPATCEMRKYVVDGCLMTYSASLTAMFRRMAYFVDRILKGANPANLPIEQPREFEFVINLRTAQALGLSVPPLLLGQTTEVIQ